MLFLMKILKLLNKNNLIVIIISIFLFSTNIYGEDEQVDIWNLENQNENNTPSYKANYCRRTDKGNCRKQITMEFFGFF